MKFIVFNLVVALSIGYLVFAEPGQSVGNWLDNLVSEFDQNKQILTQNSDETPNLKHHLVKDQPELKPKVEQESTKISKEQIKQIAMETVQGVLNEASSNLRKENLGSDEGALHATEIQPALNASANRKQIKNPVPEKEEDLKMAFEQLYTENSGRELENLIVKSEAPSHKQENLDGPEKPIFMSNSERQIALSELIQNLQLKYVTLAIQ